MVKTFKEMLYFLPINSLVLQKCNIIWILQLNAEPKIQNHKNIKYHSNLIFNQLKTKNIIQKKKKQKYLFNHLDLLAHERHGPYLSTLSCLRIIDLKNTSNIIILY